MTSIRTAIIGVSGFGEKHYRDLMREVKAGRMEPTAATIINQDEEKAKCEELRSLGCTIFTDYREMLKRFGGRLELCMIPTGIHLHAPMTVAALHAGCNVFVEKPAAATYAEVGAMKAAERDTGRFVAVGFQGIYQEDTLAVKRAILDGRIGLLRSIDAFGHWPRSDRYYGRNKWAGQLELGGAKVMDSPFNNAFSHFLNLQCFFAGATEGASVCPASVQAELYRTREIPSCDTAALRLETEEGTRLHLHVTHACREESAVDVHIRGEKGSLTFRTGKPVRMTFADGKTEKLLDPSGTPERHAVMDRLLARCHDPSAFVCTLDIAECQTMAANVAHESGPIRDIGHPHVERIVESGFGRMAIHGIEELVRRGAEEGKLFSEMNVTWATIPGKRVVVAESRTIT